MYRSTTVLRSSLLAALLGAAATAAGQQLDLEKVGDLRKQPLLAPSGGLSANTIFYDGNGGAGRAPFTYFLNGNLNIKVAGLVDLPFSFNLTNSGSGFSYPVSPNRLSLHPKYKSVRAHIGDVNMTFSPYTLNGHQFRGLGLDFDRVGKFQISVMGGRLQRAIEYDSTNRTVPAAYRRFGYGAKANYVQKNVTLGMIVFGAKDAVNSLRFRPDTLQLFPKQNLAMSWNGLFVPAPGVELSAEYALSALTRDQRDTTATGSSSGGLLKGLVGRRNSTSLYKAYRANLNYRYKQSTIGVGYERVDPGYETLGAYYFNNDLQNITVNFAQTALKGKANVSASVGYQRDDLDGQKAGMNKRSVLSVNLNYVPSTKLMLSGSYSNFSTFMNIKPVFLEINQVSQFQNYDSLNFTQISQNANLNVNYVLEQRAERTQGINLNVSFLNSGDEQGGRKRANGQSSFYNLALAYTVARIPQGMSLTAAFNAQFNRIGTDDFVTMGPTVALRARVLRAVQSSFVVSYNASKAGSVTESKVLNLHLNFSHAFKKRHNLLLGVMNQARNLRRTGSTNDLVITTGYGYVF
ncbi:hypothetical protein [Flaviaesturariibacter amylovorans]|uniref:DUF5723 domain-containing protein n=1 Tax=Flaviaesturariibacter amylovorans TaxID=1084520 RepID=A0ABP8HNY0_9BACT